MRNPKCRVKSDRGIPLNNGVKSSRRNAGFFCEFFYRHMELKTTGTDEAAHDPHDIAATFAVHCGIPCGLLALAICFAAITLFDAAGVRYAASQQAMLLNQITEELFSEHTFNVPRLKELLGHTRKEVLAGMVTGVVSGVAVVKILW